MGNNSVCKFVFFFLLEIFVLAIFPNTNYAQTFTNNTGGLIPDNGSTISFKIYVSGLPTTTNTINFGLESVMLNIQHPYLSDLKIELVSPSNTVVLLVNAVGSNGDDFINTVLTDTAAVSISSGASPFTGVFQPQGALATFNSGINPNGVWKLNITDSYPVDQGFLNNYSITFGTNPNAPYTFESSNLPLVYINTNGQSINNSYKISADMGIIYNGDGNLNYTNGSFNHYNGKIGIEYRGQSSLNFDQKQFNIETRKVDGTNLDTSILGMPPENDWVLYAPYNDKSLMRNVLTYQLSRNMGRWAARTHFCEVFINEEYRGVYVFMEKIKRDKNRVDVKKLYPSSNSPDSITGGYIVNIDKDAPNFYSNYAPLHSTSGQSIGFTFQYPDPNEISINQSNYIKEYVDSFETALNGILFQDPVLGYHKYISVKTFVDYFILNELSRNVDGYRLSSYFYKDRNTFGGQLKAGPVWDFNLAWHNADYCEGDNASGWAYRYNEYCSGDNWQIPFWWERMMEDSIFQNKLFCRWSELRGGLLSQSSLFNWIDSSALVLNEAQKRHFNKFKILGTYLWPNPSPLAQTYSEEIQNTKNWIEDRLIWLDANILAEGNCFTGIQNLVSDKAVDLWPNPCKTNFAIQFDESILPYSLEIFNLHGKREFLKELDNRIMNTTINFNVNQLGLSKGVYLIKLNYFKTVKYLKLVVS